MSITIIYPPGLTQEQVQVVLESIPDGILYGGLITWSEEGHTYDVSLAKVKFNNETPPVIFEATQITFDNGDANDRFDYPYIDAEGFKIKKGEPGANPFVPQLEEGQFGLTPFLIRANSIEPEPGDVATQNVYQENAEWAGSHSGAGAVDFEDDSNPSKGAVAINASNIVGVKYITFDAGADFQITEGVHSFDLLLKEPFPKKLSLIRFVFFDANDNYLGSSQKANFDKDLVGQYQKVVIPHKNIINRAADTARKVMLAFSVGNGVSHQGFLLDNWTVQTGIDQPAPASEHDSLPGIKGKGTIHLSEEERDKVTAIKTISIGGNSFDYRPIIGNDGSAFQVGDKALGGWIDANRFGDKLIYTGAGAGTGENFDDWHIELES